MGRLPDFLIIGASRCGTSSLFRNLLQHPQIEGPRYKEVHFFSTNKRYNRGIEWYKSQFPESKKNTLCFEASPAYLHTPICAERIFNHLPICKFIVLLRNPIDRVASGYSRWMTGGREWNPYELMAKNSYHPSMERGIYEKPLRRWFGYFPRDQFLIIKSEDFFGDEKKIIMQCSHWLGVELMDIGKPLFFDQKGKKKERLPYQREIPDAVKEYLRKLFKPYNQELYQLLGRDFGWQ